MTLLPEILTIYILNFLFFIFASLSFVLTLQILKGWKVEETTSLQYSLEKRSYLSSTIIKYMFYIKLPLFIFFVFTLDKLSFILPGAMCGAGVVDSNEYASILFFLKVLNLYLFAYWIVLDSEDMKEETQPYLKKKFTIFAGLFVLLVSEIILETLTFSSIDVESVVDCCGAIFSHSDDTYLSRALNLPLELLLTLFYTNFFLLVLSAFFKRKLFFAFLNLAFFIMSLLSLVAFFGTYVYELPTHHCPFCLLQVEYNYVGYLLYTLLFLGTFNGLIVAFIEFKDEELKRRVVLSLVFNFIYLVIVTLYPALYYMDNGVWM